MPLDNQRVMIFEKIEFAVTSYDKEREKIKSNSEANSADREPRHEESVNLEDLHADVMKNLFKQVKQIKKLYRKKLPDYALQVQRAKKYGYKHNDPDMTSDNTEQSIRKISIETFESSPLPRNMHRPNTFINNSNEKKKDEAL